MLPCSVFMDDREAGIVPSWWDIDFSQLGIAAPALEGDGRSLSETEHVRLAHELVTLGRPDLKGVLDVVRGEEALSAGDYPAARQAFDNALPALKTSQRPTACLRALVGLAELSALAGEWATFKALTVETIGRVEGEDEPQVRARATAVLQVNSVLAGEESGEDEWRAAISWLEAEGESTAAWRLYQALALALETMDRLPEALEGFEAAQAIARVADQGILLSQSILCCGRILFHAGRHPECDDRVEEALEASRMADDVPGLDSALALGCDVAVALGQPNLLLQRSMQRSDLAQGMGQLELCRQLVRQALVTALRTSSSRSREIGHRLVALSGPEGGAYPGHAEVADVLQDIATVGLNEEARDLALQWARYRFSQGWKREAGLLLRNAARLTRELGDLPLALEMQGEAVAIAEMFGLEESEQWRKERENQLEESS